MNDQKHYAFNDGMPTKPDVDAILKVHPAMSPGWRCDKDELAGIVKLQPDSSRWRSVLTALKARIRREHGLVMLYDRTSREFFIATAADTIARTSDVFGSVGRKLRHQRKDLILTSPTATESERPILEHQTRLVHTLERESKKQNMNLLPSTETKAAPQIVPPKSVQK